MWKKCGSTRATTPILKIFKTKEYTDAEYQAELQRLEDRFTPAGL